MLSRNLHMHLRFIISLILAALITPTIFGQDKSQLTVDELVESAALMRAMTGSFSTT